MKARFGNISGRKKAVVCVTALLLVWYAFCLPRRLFDAPFATVVTDRHGELLGARIAADGQWRFPPCDTVPPKFAACLIEFEDRYFRRHPGVNPLAMGRALLQNIRSKRVVSGGSTLTMQTIRLSRGKDRTLLEKCVETVLATRLELRCSKDRILALYASHAPFGGNVVGIDAAAWRYFGHAAGELSWAEAATLAVLPNAPAMIHFSRNREALLKKRNRLLMQLRHRGIIDEIDCELALSEPLPSEPLPLPQIAPHLVSYFFGQRPGMQTVSTVDRNIQVQLESLLSRRHAEFAGQDIRNLAAVVIDVRTGRTIAYCGNVDFGDGKSGNQVDVIRSPRSTGSILKPLLYCAALQDGDILPHTLLPDIPVNINGFSPQNISLQFDGAVPASQAVARSLNVPSVMLLRRYGVPKFHDFLRKAGLSTLSKPSSHYGLSLILGGAEATLWDVASAYLDMARALCGLERLPCSLVADEHREALPPLFRPGAVWQTFEAIRKVNRPEEIDLKMIPSMQSVAWKTGTSYGFRDAWAVGVTPRYVVGVWVGNASGEGRPGLLGARTAGPVMFDIFNILPASGWFDNPEREFVEAEICRHSGQLKGRFCDDADTVAILPAGLKTQACPYHIHVTLSADERFRVFEHCAGTESIINKNFFVLPPAWEWYYRQRHPEYRPLPPFKPGCGSDALMPMQFIYPHSNNTAVTLPIQLDGSPGAVTFELAHSHSDATVFWHLDKEYITATRDFHKITLTPSAGRHSLTAVDGEGNTLSISVIVNGAMNNN
ncbi:MAG: penicillin-binding protein 1C [Tannerella sp.]|jgi:penicillin-binding protein 1C|nr:penicillin-binding protein 1C [Tannerella sp.]